LSGRILTRKLLAPRQQSICVKDF